MTDDNIIDDAITYSKISLSMKKSFGMDSPSDFKIGGGPITKAYAYPQGYIPGDRFGCANIDANGMISILQCGSGNGCYMIGDHINQDQVCNQLYNKRGNDITLQKCNLKSHFMNPRSHCYLAYSQMVGSFHLGS